MFSTDYPHWDFDDPQHAFKFAMTEQQKAHGVPGQRQGVVRPAVKPSGRRPRASTSRRAQCKIVTVNGREIGVFNVERRIFRAGQPLPA